MFISVPLIYWHKLAFCFPINETPVIKTPRTMSDSAEANTSLKTAVGVMTPYKFGYDVHREPCPNMSSTLPTLKGIISWGG